MSIDPSNIVVGTHIVVKNGAPVHALLNGTAPPRSGRAPFNVWAYGGWMGEGQYQGDGAEFEIVLAPRRKKVVYSHFEVSGKFVALRRVSDGALVETYYICVRYDAVIKPKASS